MKILIVDDHAVVREGLRRLLSTLPNAEVLEAISGLEALSLAQAHQPEVVLLDLELPRIGGLELLKRLLTLNAKTRVLVFSMHAEVMYAARALQAGARGYLSKNASPEELKLGLQRVMDGGRYVESEIARELAIRHPAEGDPWNLLTERDLEILRLLSDGRSLSEIATAVGISYKTVANTCTRIKAKLGVSRTADLVRLCIEMGVS